MPRAGTRTKAKAMPLPHERDETTDKGQPRRPLVIQAAADLAQGQVDTDNYTRATDVAKAAPKKRSRN